MAPVGLVALLLRVGLVHLAGHVHLVALVILGLQVARVHLLGLLALGLQVGLVLPVLPVSQESPVGRVPLVAQAKPSDA